jgi:hypothetical protein
LLPVITIGLSEPAKEVAASIADGRGIWHFTTTEDAHWALEDAADREDNIAVFDALDALADDNPKAVTWYCHIFYGEGVLGEVLTKQPELLEHKGTTIVLVDTIGDDPGTVRRVRDGVPEAIEDKRELWSGIPRLGAKAVGALDLLDLAGQSALTGLMSQAEADLASISLQEG